MFYTELKYFYSFNKCSLNVNSVPSAFCRVQAWPSGNSYILTLTEPGHGFCYMLPYVGDLLRERQPHLTDQSSLCRHSVPVSPNTREQRPHPLNDFPEEPRHSVRPEEIPPQQAGGMGDKREQSTLMFSPKKDSVLDFCLCSDYELCFAEFYSLSGSGLGFPRDTRCMRWRRWTWSTQSHCSVLKSPPRLPCRAGQPPQSLIATGQHWHSSFSSSHRISVSFSRSWAKWVHCSMAVGTGISCRPHATWSWGGGARGRFLFALNHLCCPQGSRPVHPHSFIFSCFSFTRTPFALLTQLTIHKLQAQPQIWSNNMQASSTNSHRCVRSSPSTFPHCTVLPALMPL